MDLPYQLKNKELRFIRVGPRSKIPLDKDWQKTKNFEYDSVEFLDHIKKGGNYGVVAGFGKLLVIDADTSDIVDRVESGGAGDTFTVESGSGGRHYYYYTDEFGKTKPLDNDKGENVAHIKWVGSQVIGPGSVHPNGKQYAVCKDLPVRRIGGEEVRTLFSEYFEKKTAAAETGTANLLMGNVADLSKGVGHGDEIAVVHPIHGSKTGGGNVAINKMKNVWHCWRHDTGGGPLHWIGVIEKIINCSDCTPNGVSKAKWAKIFAVAKEKYGLADTAEVVNSVDKTKKELKRELDVFCASTIISGFKPTPEHDLPSEVLEYTYYNTPESQFELVRLQGSNDVVFADWINRELSVIGENEKNQKFLDHIRSIKKAINNVMVVSNKNPTRDYAGLFSRAVTLEKSMFYIPDPENYEYATAYAFSSWFRECQDIVGYLRFLALKGSGKTTAVDAIKKISFRSISTVTPTPASICRFASYHATFINIDEAKFGGNDGEETNIWDIIRVRNTRTTPHVMADKNSASGLIIQEVFGHTIISGKQAIPDDIEDRSKRINIVKKAGFKVKRDAGEEVESVVLELSALRQCVLLNSAVGDMRKDVERLKLALLDMNFENRYVDTIAPMIYFMPKANAISAIKFAVEEQNERLNEELSSDDAEVFEILQEVIAEHEHGAFAEGEKDNATREIQISALFDKAAKKRHYNVANMRDGEILGAKIKLGNSLKNFGFRQKHTNSGNATVVKKKIYAGLCDRYGDLRKIEANELFLSSLTFFEQRLGEIVNRQTTPFYDTKSEDVKTGEEVEKR